MFLWKFSHLELGMFTQKTQRSPGIKTPHGPSVQKWGWGCWSTPVPPPPPPPFPQHCPCYELEILTSIYNIIEQQRPTNVGFMLWKSPTFLSNGEKVQHMWCEVKHNLDGGVFHHRNAVLVSVTGSWHPTSKKQQVVAKFDFGDGLAREWSERSVGVPIHLVLSDGPDIQTSISMCAHEFITLWVPSHTLQFLWHQECLTHVACVMLPEHSQALSVTNQDLWNMQSQRLHMLIFCYSHCFD